MRVWYHQVHSGGSSCRWHRGRHNRNTLFGRSSATSAGESVGAIASHCTVKVESKFIGLEIHQHMYQHYDVNVGVSCVVSVAVQVLVGL